jgi:hypothetical protein
MQITFKEYEQLGWWLIIPPVPKNPNEAKDNLLLRRSFGPSSGGLENYTILANAAVGYHSLSLSHVEIGK